MRVVQVGQGAFGWRWFQEILVKSEHVEVVGIVEHNQELLQRAAEVAGVAQENLFSDLNEALEKGKPDFVLNTTPPHIHSEIIRTCLRYGIPVLCEKPVSDDWEDALYLYQDVQRSGVRVMIAENYRYKPIIRQTKRLLVEGGMLS
ncbi:Gfo/Idh/MocA family oxidoreductase [Paenibacillus sp. FSL R10-2734]|uniref:Gfo/Idh/MocA family protein n=1 Tax=Paenibacillus sp. FSL R10-2734 TaxID=2954691 RepID=UPI0030DB8408